MKDKSTWNDLILKAHFQSLSPGWQEKEPVVALLSEIAVRLKDPEPLTPKERDALHSRIKNVLQGAESLAPRPMRAAGRRKGEQQKKKTGS